MKNERVAYAAAFCSYLIERVGGIRSVILFGSVSRGDADKESDIDIFVDCVSANKERIKKTVETFYGSQLAKQWNLKGIKNPISVIAGNLDSDEWQSLKRSIITDGIVLFGKYTAKPEKTKHAMLFSYGNIQDARKRVRLHRKLFGYRTGNIRYDGIVQRVKGIRYGSGTFSVPIEHHRDVQQLFRDMKITPTIREIWIDE